MTGWDDEFDRMKMREDIERERRIEVLRLVCLYRDLNDWTGVPCNAPMCCYECKECKNYKRLCKFEKYTTIALDLQAIDYYDELDTEANDIYKSEKEDIEFEKKEYENMINMMDHLDVDDYDASIASTYSEDE